MIEVWVLLALGAALLFAISNVLDKLVITKEMRDPILGTIIVGIVSFVIYSLAGLFLGEVNFSFNYLAFLVLFFASGFNLLAVFYYYKAFKRGDVSRVATLLALHPLGVLALAFVFLGERLIIGNYIGIFLIVGGALLISFNKTVSSKNKVLATVFSLLMVLFFSIRETITKFVSSDLNVASILFWFAIGNLIFALFIYLFYHPKLNKKQKKGLKHLFFVGSIGAIARVLLIVAITIGSVSLVTALISIRTAIVFAFAVILRNYKPELLGGQMNMVVLIRRIFAIGLIIAGSFLIV
tara:strand:- start:508 stop:1395 length:888 start_codon:yes stop_codon:yes gene_type:complete